MTILPPDFIAKYLTSHTLPGSVFFHIQDARLKTEATASILLVATKTDTGWSNPSYVVLINVGDFWHICPWISGELHQILKKYPSPEEFLAGIPKQTLEEASKVQSIDQIVRDTATLRESSEKAVELKNKLLNQK